jgi:hypothetical protein
MVQALVTAVINDATTTNLAMLTTSSRCLQPTSRSMTGLEPTCDGVG